MKQTTLCYLERDGQYLMLHRVKKEHDENHDKWIGVGGKFEDKESPEDCVCREVLEETGLMLTEYRYCGLVTFVSDVWPTEYMHLFHATGFTGTAFNRSTSFCVPETAVSCRASTAPARPPLTVNKPPK